MMLKKIFYPNWFLKKLADLQFAISLLLAIGVCIAIGTFIEQEQSLSFYQKNYPVAEPIFGFVNWQLIIKLSLDKVYSSIYFFVLVILFGSSLLACTFRTQLPALKKFRLWKFINQPAQVQKFPLKEKVPCNLTNTTSYEIHLANYHVFRQSRKNYAYSGLLGRVGPILVHFSILILLFGVSIGTLSGYTVQELVPRGEIFHLQNLVKSNPYTNLPQNVLWRVNDFWITYTSDSKVNQFYSDLSLLDSNGTELKRKTIFVNEPFTYKGLTVYQTDWDILGIKLILNEDKDLQLPFKQIKKGGRKFWLSSFTLPLENRTTKLTVLLNDLKGNIYIYDNAGNLLQDTVLGQDLQLGQENIKFSDIITGTGLQIKADAGLSIVYISFFCIMVSIYVSFLSYSQIWSLQDSKYTTLIGQSTRAKLEFQNSFRKCMRKIIN